MRYVRSTLVNAADASVSQATQAIDGNQLFSMSAQTILTGSPVGGIKMQASNDFGQATDAGPFVPTNWNDIPGTTSSISASGSYLIPKQDLAYRWVRIVYTAVSGTGSVTINVMALSV